MRKVTIIICTLLASTLVDGSCSSKNTHKLGHCAYRIECANIIHGIEILKECLGSSNYNTSINIMVRDASEALGAKEDPDVLESVTSLTVTGYWPQTNLSFLQNMYRIKKLNVIKSKISHINGSPFRSLSRLESLSLSHNALTNIDEIFQFDTRPIWMRSLSLAYNAITDISSNAFDELTSLTELDLSYNSIVELDEDPFANLTDLEVLRLNNNQIKDLNGALNNLINLKHLYLKYNEIQNINVESLMTINHLETFDISQNQLENLKPLVFSRHWYHFGDHSICRIILSSNYIKHLPNTTYEDLYRDTRNTKQNRVDVLTELDLSNNNISHIEYNAFQSIVQLTTLNLSNNKLNSFIVNADHLKYVKYLNLSSNYLRKLHYESFYSMHHLQNLDLSNNEIDYFPDQSLSNTDSLKHINLTYNMILTIRSLRIIFHPEGGILDLSNNGLSSLNIPNNEAHGLTELILSFNNISEAFQIKLADQRHLTRLHLSNNVIQELDKNALQLPVTLGYLDMSFNLIEKIGPSSFHRVTHLNRLRLSHNLLKDIEYGAFSGLSYLQDLDLSFNKIAMLDSKLLLDLKYLRILSLRHNGLYVLDQSGWFAHKLDLTIYLDENKYSCNWLATALSDYNNGYTKMRPTVLDRSISGHNIEGIPCEQDDNKIIERPMNILSDERLLATSQKILEAILEQSSFIRKYVEPVKGQDQDKK